MNGDLLKCCHLTAYGQFTGEFVSRWRNFSKKSQNVCNRNQIYGVLAKRLVYLLIIIGSYRDCDVYVSCGANKEVLERAVVNICAN